MLVDTFLRWLVVVRAHAEDAVHTIHFETVKGLDHLSRVVATHAEDHRHTVAHEFHGGREQLLLLVLGEGDTFTRGAHAHHVIHATGDLVFQQFLQACVIDAAVGAEGSDQCDAEAAETFVHVGCAVALS